MLVALAACGGGQEPAPATADPPPPPPVATRPDAEPGRVLLRFVAAARRGDTAEVWGLLSRPSRAGLGGSEGRFARGAARTLVRSLRPLRPGLRIVLSQRVDPRWAVAALAGRRVEEGELAAFAYGGALRREGGSWRIEIGGLIVGGVRPEPLDEVDENVELRADSAASARVRSFLLWLDGQPVAARAESDTPFAARIRADVRTLRPGEHVGVAFAATGAAAGAVAWPFFVR